MDFEKLKKTVANLREHYRKERMHCEKEMRDVWELDKYDDGDVSVLYQCDVCKHIQVI